MRVKALLAWLTILALVVGATFMVAAQAAQKYHEAPMLHELVLQGKLPPVDQRLPQNPKVVQPYKQIGQYGGTLLRVYTGPGDVWNFIKFAGYSLIKRIPGGVEPNIVDQWKVEDGGKTLVIHLREGIKWSDGVPLTVDDFIYAWGLAINPNLPEDIIGDAARILRDPAGKLATLEKVNDYTVKIHYSTPFPLAWMGLTAGPKPLIPKHYFIQFDPRYNHNIKDFSTLYQKLPFEHIGSAMVGCPMLSAWVVTEYKPNVQLVAERNPYYWKVDSAGNQLPYVDRVIWQYAGSEATIPLMVAAGKISVQSRHLRFSDYTFYKQNEKKGNYRTQVIDGGSLAPAIQFNYDCPDPVLRNLIQNKDFRVALSYATDREEISRAVYKGLAKPWPFCQLPASPYFPGDKYAKMYVQYNIDKANAILDQLGLKDTDGDGIRNRPDGKNLSIIIDYAPTGAGGATGEIAELLPAQWKKVGIKVVLNPMDRSLLLPRLRAGKFEAMLWNVDAALNFIPRADNWLPAALTEFQMYKSATNWFLSGGKEGKKPALQWVITVQNLYRELMGASDRAKQVALGKEIMAMVTENCYQIGTVTTTLVGIVSNKVGNVPDHWVRGDMFLGMAVIRPWQFYIKQGS